MSQKHRTPKSRPPTKTKSTFKSYRQKTMKMKMKRIHRDPTTPTGR